MAPERTLRTFVVDDEPLARDLIASYVAQTPSLTLAGKFDNAVDALHALQNDPVDLLLLDIQMPQLSGLELSRLLPSETRVIFTTAFEQYALEGFRVDALDYLLKPISYSEFLRAVTKAQRWFATMDAAKASGMPSNDVSNHTTETLFVRADYKMVQVHIADILYIEGLKDYVRIHTIAGAPVTTQTTLKEMEQLLPADRFLRVHRSYIVNLERIEVIERNQIIFGKVRITISDSCKDRFMELISRRAQVL